MSETSPEADPLGDELRALLASLPKQNTSRLGFEKQCSVLYALRNGASHESVSVAYGVSLATISMIDNSTRGRCGRKVWRYGSVASELEKLGLDGLGRKYFTREDRANVIRCTHASRAMARSKGTPNHSASLYAKSFDLFVDEQWASLSVKWIDQDVEPGWYWFIDLDKTNSPHGDDEDRPFRTSALAFDAAHETVGHESPRPKPGRPRKFL